MSCDLTSWLDGVSRASETARLEHLRWLTPERAAVELERLLATRGEFIGRDSPSESSELVEIEADALAVREASPSVVPEAFRAIAACLDELRIPYAVIGGIAAGLQGQPRYTSDVDLVLRMPVVRLRELVQALRDRGFTVEPELVRLQWLASGFARIWYGEENDGIAVDLLSSRGEFLKTVLWRAQAARFAGVRTRVASPEDLILLKSMAWRAFDIGDAQRILERHSSRIDGEYLRKWAADLAASRADLHDLPARIAALLGDGPYPPFPG